MPLKKKSQETQRKSETLPDLKETKEIQKQCNVWSLLNPGLCKNSHNFGTTDKI